MENFISNIENMIQGHYIIILHKLNCILSVCLLIGYYIVLTYALFLFYHSPTLKV